MVVGVAGRDFQNLKKIGKKLNWENFSNKQSLVYGVFTILVYTSLVLEWHLSNNCCCTTCADLDRGLKLKKKIKLVKIDSSNIPRLWEKILDWSAHAPYFTKQYYFALLSLSWSIQQSKIKLLIQVKNKDSQDKQIWHRFNTYSSLSKSQGLLMVFQRKSETMKYDCKMSSKKNLIWN